MTGNTRFLIWLGIIGFAGLSSFITAIYFDRKFSKKTRSKNEFKTKLSKDD